MAPQIAWGRFSLLTVSLIGIGYGFMTMTTPSEKELYNSLPPDLQRKVDANRAARQNALNAQKLTSNPDEAKPIWSDSPK